MRRANAQTLAADSPAIGVSVSPMPEGLTSLEHPGCAAAIWRRHPLARFQSWIDDLRPEQLPRARLVLRPQFVYHALSDIVDASGLACCDERAMLVDDIAALAAIFAEVVRAPVIRLRLDVVSTNTCPDFRIDAVTARLICTYRGTGTQYGIVRDGTEPRDIVTVPTGSPICLRGTRWPDAPPSGLRHRSPPIEGSDEARLVLALDPVFDLEGRAVPHVLH